MVAQADWNNLQMNFYVTWSGGLSIPLVVSTPNTEVTESAEFKNIAITDIIVKGNDLEQKKLQPNAQGFFTISVRGIFFS